MWLGWTCQDGHGAVREGDSDRNLQYVNAGPDGDAAAGAAEVADATHSLRQPALVRDEYGACARLRS